MTTIGTASRTYQLTDQQRYALERLNASRDGLTPTEIAACSGYRIGTIQTALRGLRDFGLARVVEGARDRHIATLDGVALAEQLAAKATVAA